MSSPGGLGGGGLLGCFGNLPCPQSRDFDGQWSPVGGKFDMSAILACEEFEKNLGTRVQMLFIVYVGLRRTAIVELDEQISNKLLFILFLDDSLLWF